MTFLLLWLGTFLRCLINKETIYLLKTKFQFQKKHVQDFLHQPPWQNNFIIRCCPGPLTFHFQPYLFWTFHLFSSLSAVLFLLHLAPSMLCYPPSLSASGDNFSLGCVVFTSSLYLSPQKNKQKNLLSRWISLHCPPPPFIYSSQNLF